MYLFAGVRRSPATRGRERPATGSGTTATDPNFEALDHCLCPLIDPAQEVGLEELHLGRPRRIVDLDDEGPPVPLEGSDMGGDRLPHQVGPLGEHRDRGLPIAAPQGLQEAVHGRRQRAGILAQLTTAPDSIRRTRSGRAASGSGLAVVMTT